MPSPNVCSARDCRSLPARADGRAAAVRRTHPLSWIGFGDSGRPVVLIHGLTRTAWTWLPVARRLGADTPGRGPGPPRSRRHRTHRSRATSWSRWRSMSSPSSPARAGARRSVAPPPSLAGHGLGAMVAVEMARLEPGQRGRRDAARRRLGGDGRRHAPAARPARRSHGRSARGAGLDGRLPGGSPRLRSQPAGTPTRRPRRAHRCSRSMPGTSAWSPGDRSSGAWSTRCTATSRSRRWPQVRCPVTVLVASSATADDEDERERSPGTRGCPAGPDSGGSRRDDRAALRWRRPRPDALPARRCHRGAGTPEPNGSRPGWAIRLVTEPGHRVSTVRPQDLRVPRLERAPGGRRGRSRWLLGWRADRALVH